MDQKIVNWIQYDNQIKEHNDEVKKLKKIRDEVGEGMMTEINSNDNLRENLPTYNITHMNTSLAFHKTNTYENYTNKFYMECFTEFLDSEEQATKLIEFMKKKRKVESKISLKRGYLMD
tara:strand:- start:5 stop:361 length:357 start_codon:yes stop_codon:yes gene_type:complete